MIRDLDTTQEDQAAINNTRMQTQIDTLDARLTGVDVKLELLCRAVKELTKVVKGKATMGSSSSEPLLQP